MIDFIQLKDFENNTVYINKAKITTIYVEGMNSNVLLGDEDSQSSNNAVCISKDKISAIYADGNYSNILLSDGTRIIFDRPVEDLINFETWLKANERK